MIFRHKWTTSVTAKRLAVFLAAFRVGSWLVACAVVPISVVWGRAAQPPVAPAELGDSQGFSDLGIRDANPVDEPLGARYSLGMTLWHMGHSAPMISRFHDYLREAGLSPEKLLPRLALRPPASMVRALIEPELLGNDRLNGWKADGGYITSSQMDAGPTVSIPMHVPRADLYRLWVQYDANVNNRGVMFLKIYRAGAMELGPLCQPDEIYDVPAEKAGPTWHDILLDLPAGDLIIQFGHVTRSWQGPGGYDFRRIDCVYFTNELWAAPLTPDERKTLRDGEKPDGIQWTSTPPLGADKLSHWKWWLVRPLSWEDEGTNPKLFQLSRRFWQSVIDDLARKDYPESALPDYRAPERQVVFNETWNMTANPVRARRQIDILTADVSQQPLPYHYVWHDVGGNIEGLRTDGDYKNTLHSGYGGWYGGSGHLEASYGTPTGTVTTRAPVAVPGKYFVWVLSSPTNLGYSAPWFGKVSVEGKEQFTYHHQGNIASVWMKMGEVTVDKPGSVQVDFTLDGAGAGATYRRIYTLFLVDNPAITPTGSIRPPWTMEMFNRRAAQAGARPGDKLLMWLSKDPYRTLSQEVWSDRTTAGDAWPEGPVSGVVQTQELLMARDTNRAVQVGLHNLTRSPLSLEVRAGPLRGKGGTFPGSVRWRVESFIPYGGDRQAWTPFFLLRRNNITVPPLNVAGVWLTVDTHGIPAGDYTAQALVSGPGTPAHRVEIKVRVSPVTSTPRQQVLIQGWTKPQEGQVYLRDFMEHGMNVWPEPMSKADMQRWGIRLLALPYWSTSGIPEFVANLKALNLDYSDYFVSIMDEPGATTEEGLKPFLDVAKAFRAVDPKVRLSFDPGESAELKTFQILAPYCDFWVPYSKHVFSPDYGDPEKRKIFLPKPWMWYTTPDLWDKTARDPGIRMAPSQPGNCVGVAFFALNYPWRDQWDTGYEQVPDASTMGAVLSRHGPVAPIVWEQIQEASQTANLAMLIRERVGAKSFDEVTDPVLQRLIREGTEEELIRWLEGHPG